jgi:predicted metal-binding membrane protein
MGAALMNRQFRCKESAAISALHHAMARYVLLTLHQLLTPSPSAHYTLPLETSIVHWFVNQVATMLAQKAPLANRFKEQDYALIQAQDQRQHHHLDRLVSGQYSMDSSLL